MAEIDVVKGKSNSWLWWVIAAIALVLLLMFFMRGRDADTPTRAPGSSAIPSATAVVAV